MILFERALADKKAGKTVPFELANAEKKRVFLQLVRMRSPVRIRVSAPEKPVRNDWFLLLGEAGVFPSIKKGLPGISGQTLLFRLRKGWMAIPF